MNGEHKTTDHGSRNQVARGRRAVAGNIRQPMKGPAEVGTTSHVDLLTRRELAARCQVDVRTIERWQAEGVVPFIKVREVVRFHWPTTIAHLLAHFTVLHDGEETQGKN